MEHEDLCLCEAMDDGESIRIRPRVVRVHFLPAWAQKDYPPRHRNDICRYCVLLVQDILDLPFATVQEAGKRQSYVSA